MSCVSACLHFFYEIRKILVIPKPTSESISCTPGIQHAKKVNTKIRGVWRHAGYYELSFSDRCKAEMPVELLQPPPVSILLSVFFSLEIQDQHFRKNPKLCTEEKFQSPPKILNILANFSVSIFV